MILLLSVLHFIAQPVVNMHAEPDPLVEVVSQAIYGSQVSILEKRDGWSEIETADGYTGWIVADAIESKPTPYPATPLVAKTRTRCTHIYRTPDTTPAPPLLSLPYGTRVELLSDGGDERWHHCRLLDGKEAWIQRGDFQIGESPLTLDEAIALGKSWIGTPYTWGGTTSFGIDCSGLVQLLYREIGIDLPRDSNDQARVGILISPNDLEAGDLLFFGWKRITHVGIYIGSGELLHSDVQMGFGPPAVRIDELSKMNRPLLLSLRVEKWADPFDSTRVGAE